MKDVIEVSNLKKYFDGVAAVDDLSIEITRGKITGIVGPNGSGKTTLINLLTGIIQLDSGVVRLGADLKLDRILPHDVLAYGLTRTFQNIRLFEQLPVLDNILLVLTERNVFGAMFERHQDYHLKQARTVLLQVGLWEKRHEKAENLSYGQRKLLEIARALATRADTYLLDEPFAGLFPEMIKLVSGVVRELQAAGRTVILIEHNMDIIRDLCDHLIVMDAGKLLAEGEPEAVLARREVAEAYLGE